MSTTANVFVVMLEVLLRPVSEHGYRWLLVLLVCGSSKCVERTVYKRCGWIARSWLGGGGINIGHEGPCLYMHYSTHGSKVPGSFNVGQPLITVTANLLN